MSQKQRNIPPASTRAPSSSVPSPEHRNDIHNAGDAGGKAAERGRQPPDATRPPREPSTHNNVNGATDVQQLINTAATFLEALDAPDGSSSSIQTTSLRAFLHDAKETLTTLQREPTPHPTTNAILREVQAVHEAVKGLATPPASPPTSPRPTRAQIASALAPTPPRSPTPPSKGPELTLRISDPEERRNAQSLPNEAIIQKIQQERPDGKEVVAIKKLPSGDVRLFLAGERTKAALLQERSWTTCLGQSCSVAENVYKVLVHRVRLDSIDPKRAEDVAKVQEENQILHSGLRITRLSWLNRGHAPGKTHSSLIVGVATEQMANGIIQRGLVSNFALHLAEYYSPESRLTQRFKCQAYGHVAPVCRGTEACGHCAGKHNSQDCNTKTQLKCANCGKEHAAWSHECNIRKAAKAKSVHARYTAPTRFARQTDSVANVEEEAGWTLIGSKKRKLSPAATDRRRAGPGRPPAVQTPNARSQRTPIVRECLPASIKDIR
ncbi:Hypothetical protein D9617_87g078050 [Elsinoe fawcettii]|nr:Hypothetical protein D9617_87g078050 [Elsinoe fawcettii]